MVVPVGCSASASRRSWNHILKRLSWARLSARGRSAAAPGFPDQPHWFRDNRDFGKIEEGLRQIGFAPDEVAGLMGGNWLRFFEENFIPRAFMAASAGN